MPPLAGQRLHSARVEQPSGLRGSGGRASTGTDTREGNGGRDAGCPQLDEPERTAPAKGHVLRSGRGPQSRGASGVAVSQENVEIAKRATDALNRRDWHAFYELI